MPRALTREVSCGLGTTISEVGSKCTRAYKLCMDDRTSDRSGSFSGLPRAPRRRSQRRTVGLFGLGSGLELLSSPVVS